MKPHLPVLLLSACLGGCAGDGLRPGASGDAGVDLVQVRAAAEAAYAAQDWPESEKHYLALARQVPVEPENWFRLGNIYARTGRSDAAIAAYREVLVRDPENRKAWYNLGILQLRSAAHSLGEARDLPGPADAITARSGEVLEKLGPLLGGGAAETPGEGTAPE